MPAPYTLLGAAGQPFTSAAPGTFGGYRRRRIYGRLDCPSARRALARGHYVDHRVFFADEATAVAAGYRPCGVCLPDAYARWRADRAPTHHTPAELATVLDLATGLCPRFGGGIAVGHGRDPASAAAADAVAQAWDDRGGLVLAVVDWPEAAASWLRQARRLTAHSPDAWVVAGAPAGFAQLARRLRAEPGWDPARTVAFASLQDPRLPALAGVDTLRGLRGADPDGAVWHVRGRAVVSGGQPRSHAT